jgi:hypothetical protein
MGCHRGKSHEQASIFLIKTGLGQQFPSHSVATAVDGVFAIRSDITGKPGC